jgi:hypothetical protein
LSLILYPLFAVVSLNSKDGSDDDDVPKPSKSKSGKASKKKSSKLEKKQVTPSPKPSPMDVEELAIEDQVSLIDLFSTISLCDNLIVDVFQPDSTSEAVEVTTTLEMPKAKEGRRKRKHKVQETTIETTHTEGSPIKSSPKRRKHKHKHSNPNSAQSCVGDNVSKVIYQLDVIFNIFYSMFF